MNSGSAGLERRPLLPLGYWEERAHPVPNSGDDASSTPLGVRVGAVPLDPPGVVLPCGGPAKPKGDNASFLTVDALNAQKIKKRSLRRAIRRANIHGTTNYRGRLLRASHTQLVLQPVLPVRNHAERFEMISWNCGGLSQLLFQEIKVALSQNPAVKIAVLQETHHTYTNEWRDGEWTILHSPTAKPKQGGIMILIRNDFCVQASLRWQELIPGRLVHLRCFAKAQHVDLVALYQHALPFGSELLAQALQKRKVLWGRLDKLLRSFPARSSVLVAGDFNSGLTSHALFAGPGVLEHSRNPDVVLERQELSSMLRSHRLCALNTCVPLTPGCRRSRHTFIPLGSLKSISFL